MIECDLFNRGKRPEKNDIQRDPSTKLPRHLDNVKAACSLSTLLTEMMAVELSSSRNFVPLVRRSDSKKRYLRLVVVGRTSSLTRSNARASLRSRRARCLKQSVVLFDNDRPQTTNGLVHFLQLYCCLLPCYFNAPVSAMLLWQSWVVVLLGLIALVDAKAPPTTKATERPIKILNESGSKVEIYWIHPNTGALALMSSPNVLNGASFNLNSFIGHEFEIRELPSTKTVRQQQMIFFFRMRWLMAHFYCFLIAIFVGCL